MNQLTLAVHPGPYFGIPWDDIQELDILNTNICN